MHYVPRSRLSEFVELLWYFGGHEIVRTTKERVLPTGAVDLIIRLDSSRTSHSGIQGPRTHSVVITTPARHELLGVHFKRGRALPFLQVPMGELHNASVTLGDLWGERNAQRLLSVLQEAPSIAKKFYLLEHWLLQLAGDRLSSHPAVSFATHALSSKQFRSAAAVADKAGYSQRHFIELFRNQVGLKPKEFQRLCRFRRVVEAVKGQAAVDWANISLSAGYFDQAHLIHDFKHFSELTPEQYIKCQTPFINHVRIPA
jgi:AraC-like DNA-binding protein